MIKLREGQCHEIFEPIFIGQKTLPVPQMNMQKQFHKMFFNVKIFAKNVCP